jgi:1,6-anhydro-N-acetylmuramate kinase
MSYPKQLAADHWDYVKSILETHGEEPENIKVIGFHYRSSFQHGFKHGVEFKNESD